MKRLFFIIIFLHVITFYTVGQSKMHSKPNVLIILVDDLGYYDVSYYGTPYIKTPNIDYLCSEGVRFDRFYTNSPVCAPTRAAILSGRNPEMVGVPGLVRSHAEDNFGYLTPGTILLPQILKNNGYKTAIIGKWNLGLESPNKPNEKGFDFFHGFLDDMMDDYYNHLRYGNNLLRLNSKVVNPEGHATDIFTKWAIDYLNTQKSSRQPFFLYLAYNAPHIPIQPRQDWLEKVTRREKNLSSEKAKFVALTEHLDDGIGQVINTLKKNGQYNNTLILFLSDNGGDLRFGSNNGDLRDGKGSMYEGGIRVPAFMSWPGHIKPGILNNQSLMTMDIMPTIAEITGSKISHVIDGFSFASLLRDNQKKLKCRPLYFIRREGNTKYSGQTIQAIIYEGYKLLQNSPYEPYELYHLDNDPQEAKNIISEEKDKYLKLQALLMKQIQRGGSVPWQKPDPFN